MVAPHGRCLRHLDSAARTAYLEGLAPGADIDHRGTSFDGVLLAELLTVLQDPATGRPRFGTARFDNARFEDEVAGFEGGVFEGEARFYGARFDAAVRFDRVTFTGTAGFGDVTFAANASFFTAVFTGAAVFSRAAFRGIATFYGSAFAKEAQFSAAAFADRAWFEEVTFADGAKFDGATITGEAQFKTTRFVRRANFRKATFTGAAEFDWAEFVDAWFDAATFTSEARFAGVKFAGWAEFGETTFTGAASFVGATFSDEARFGKARFAEDVGFGDVTFTRDAWFNGVTFCRGVGFARAGFHRNARFDAAGFESEAWIGPFVCARTVALSEAVFGGPVTIDAAARTLVCWRTRWAATATLRLRYADMDLTDAVFEYPLSVKAHPTAFVLPLSGTLHETQLTDLHEGVRVTSISGTDATHLVLSDVDLSACQFTGTFHLDQLRLEGECRFAPAPTGVHRRGLRVTRWTPRLTLAEEYRWRASRGQLGWTHIDTDTTRPERVGATGLARVYRQLRKSLEDGKDEPGAADFYYGEMEMRRHDRSRPRGERSLITAYWMLSGYGLRASRALGWLLVAMTATVLAMMLWGLPKDDPQPRTTGTITGRHLTASTDTADPVDPDGSLVGRLTSKRFEKSLRVVVNSVVFRSSDQDLTTAGTYTEMASRISEPVLLGLAVLAVRSRIKR